MTAVSMLTADVAAAVVICPVAGVVLSTRRSTALVAAGAIVWILASSAWLVATGLDLPLVLVAHVVLASVALATAGIGRALRALFVDSLDAIAVGLCVCLGASFGIFVMGRFAGNLPPEVLNAALAANPLVATTSAASIDIFHTALLYRASPIAHQLYSYPAWQVSSALFAGVATASIAFAVWSARRGSFHQA